VAFRIRFWKMKNTTATGIVITAAAASLTGYCVPWLRAPEASWATPFGGYSLIGLRVGAEQLDVHVEPDGRVRVEVAPESQPMTRSVSAQ
jgi:hypothetical protein